MKAIEQFKLMVSGLGGTVYMAKTTSHPNIMSDNRRKVPKEEFLQAILQFTKSQLKEGSDTMQISIDDKVVAEIKLLDKSMF